MSRLIRRWAWILYIPSAVSNPQVLGVYADRQACQQAALVAAERLKSSDSGATGPQPGAVPACMHVDYQH